MSNRFTTAAAVRTFALGGNVLFTIVSGKTGTRFTYRVRVSVARDDGKPPKAGVFFVSLLSGPDNESDYQYLGIISKDDPMTFRLTAKSRAGEQAASVVAFRWFWGQVCQNRLPASLEVWHEGRCGRCGRTLTVPESIASGFGPECINHV